MNEKQQIKPEKITKPIQLLGAWLAGLFSVDSCFLFAASNMETGSFESISLIIASIINVPLFLVAVFLLQTKFRPELQEDSYYSTYLNRKTNEPVSLNKNEAQILELSHRLSSFESSLSSHFRPPGTNEKLLEGIVIGVNKNLPNSANIKGKLYEHGAMGCSSFGLDDGSSSKSIFISEFLPKDITPGIIKIASELGFTHYSYFDNHAENTNEQILFGGYGDAEFEL